MAYQSLLLFLFLPLLHEVANVRWDWDDEFNMVDSHIPLNPAKYEVPEREYALRLECACGRL